MLIISEGSLVLFVAETPFGEDGGHHHLRSLNCGVLTSSFNDVADELNTQHVRLIKESASLVIMLAASVDDCVPKMDRERL